MCGLVGVAGSFLLDRHQKIFNQLLVCSSVRGTHSTGVGFIYGEWDANTKSRVTQGCISKGIGNPFDIMENKNYDNNCRKTGIRAMIGHTRSATIGNISRGNAHPFDTTDIIGAHNGTIRGTQPNSNKYGTDSECLYQNITDSSVEEYLPSISGAWALTYYNFKTNSLNFIRNEERPLAMAISRTDGCIFWASELGMLEWILDRNDIKYDSIGALKPNQLISFKIFHEDWSSHYTTLNISGKKEEPVTTSYAPFRYEDKGEATTPEIKETPEKSKDGSTKPSGTTLIGKTYKGFKGQEISALKHHENLQSGCAWCSNIMGSDDTVRYFSMSEYICKDCNGKDGDERVSLLKEQIDSVSDIEVNQAYH